MTKKIKTIDVNAREWFDKVNGNSYFAATVCVNYSMPDQQNFILPFQYGYGSHYVDMAKQELERQGLISVKHHDNGSSEALWSYCSDNNIILRYSKKENCLKRDLKNIY